MSTMPERVWLYRAEYDGWSADDKLDERFDHLGPYVPEQRALDAERERDALRAERDALQSDLKALMPLARFGLRVVDTSYRKESFDWHGWASWMCIDKAVPREGLFMDNGFQVADAARAILNREGT